MSMRQIGFWLRSFCTVLLEDPAWKESILEKSSTDVPDFEETRTAEGGNADAQIILGQMYAEGTGVTQDAVQAVKWYRVAAERGDPESQYRLGGMYDRGEGVVQDQVEAAMWYQRAARQGHVDAVWRIGVMNEDGIGVTQDLVEAYAWFDFGCKIGHKGFLPRLRATERLKSPMQAGEAKIGPLITQSIQRQNVVKNKPAAMEKASADGIVEKHAKTCDRTCRE